MHYGGYHHVVKLLNKLTNFHETMKVIPSGAIHPGLFNLILLLTAIWRLHELVK
jgi:hypothetical protein